MIDLLKRWLAGSRADGLNDLRFVFDTPLGTGLSLMLLLLVGLLTVSIFWRALAKRPPRGRRRLTLSRVTMMVFACFLVLGPALVGKRLNPGQNYVVLLYDDSQSMQIQDGLGLSRGERLRQAIKDRHVEFEEVLRSRYQVAQYRFGEGSSRLNHLSELGFHQNESNHLAALKAIRRDFRGIRLSAVILFSDGIQQPNSNLSIPAFDCPIITVGVGDQNTWKDVELGSLTLSEPKGPEHGHLLKLNFRATGLAGRKLVAEILDGNRTVASKPFVVDTMDESRQLRLEFKPQRKNWQTYTARVRLQEGAFPGENAGASGLTREDAVTQNNHRDFIVDNRPKTYEVLYFSGRPNWEHKFIQQALEAEEQIRLTSVVRISAAQKKFVFRGKRSSMVNPLFEGFYQDEDDQPRYDEAVFLRFGGKRDDVGKGFPETAEALFTYDLVILGEIEARFFSQIQLDLMRDFVRKRGGTLLLLGGLNSFSEGQYAGTVLESLLPVTLSKNRSNFDEPGHLIEKFQAVPTVEGLLSGSFALDPNPLVNDRLWRELPLLTGINTFDDTRIGATVLARAEGGSSDLLPLFALQRYGEGKTAILATGSTWPWQMQTEAGDSRHNRFWRQLISYLTRDIPKPTRLKHKQDFYVEDKTVSLNMSVKDHKFDERTGLDTRLQLRTPSGKTLPLGVEESLLEAGLYTSNFVPEEPGIYRLQLRADALGKPVGELEEAIMVAADNREFHKAHYRPEFLQRLADASGGKFFSLEQLPQIPNRIPWLSQNQAEEETLPIWSFPGFYLFLTALMIFDWYARRVRGFA